MLPKIPPTEIAIVIRLFCYCLLTGASYTLSRTAADSLFLSRIGSGSLPATFLGAGIATALLASLWVALWKRYPIERFLGATCFVNAGLFLAAWWWLPRFHHSFDFLSIIYIIAEVKGCLYAINVVSSMNEMMGGHSSRSSWATVLLGFPVSAILIGMLVGVESTAWGATAWLLVAAVIDLLAGLSTIGIFRHALPSPSSATGGPQQDVTTKIAEATLPLTKYVHSTSFAKWFSILIAAKVVVLTLIAFKWRVSVNDFFAARENSLAAFFGYFYALSGVATLVVQFLITGRLLSRKRVVVPILVLPIALLILNTLLVVGVGVAFLFVVSTMAKSMDVWRRSTHSTAVHLLYTNIERKRRRGLIGHNHAFVKPMAEIATSLILLPGILLLDNAVLMIATLVWLLATMKLIGVVVTIRKPSQKDRSGTRSVNSD